VFEGSNSWSLNHTLGTAAFADAGSFATVHANSEYPDATRDSDHDPLLILLNLVCFLAGMGICTPGGDVAMEALQPGDLVSTDAGRNRPVR